MQIIEFSADNYKRLTAVRIKPDGSLVPLVGRNGAGKTSIIDAIAETLGGTRGGADKPIHEGADKAEVMIDLGEIIIKRKWTAKGTDLVVTNREGARYPKPQQKLSEMLGELSIDPLEFDSMKPAEQIVILAKIAGIDLKAYDAKRQSLETDRAVTKKQLATAQAQLSAMPEVVNPPDKEESISELLAESESIKEHNKKLEVLLFDHGKLEKEHSEEISKYEQGIQQRQERIRNYDEQIKKLTKERDDFADRSADVLDKISKNYIDLQGKIRAKDAEVMAFEKIDPEPNAKRIAGFSEQNRKFEQHKARQDKSAEVVKFTSTLETIGNELESIDQEIDTVMAATEFPIKGLKLRPDGVYLNSIPFSQESAAMRLRTSVAVGLALNPKLKVMLVRDGGNLDPDSMKLLAEIAEEHKAQVWIERPDQRTDLNQPHESGILIVDGETPETVEEAKE